MPKWHSLVGVKCLRAMSERANAEVAQVAEVAQFGGCGCRATVLTAETSVCVIVVKVDHKDHGISP